jgi:Glycosyl transferase family 2
MIAVSIIIPVGAKHHVFVDTAVASCLWQTVKQFEVILINDGGQDFHTYDDARIITVDGPNRHIPFGEQHGNRAAMARNWGIRHARGEYLVFLDADDYLLPTALETLLRGQITHNSYYTYSGHFVDGRHMRPPDYDQQRQQVFNLHPVTALVPRDAVMKVGGFDEHAPGWEDWTLWLRLAIAGYCGEYVNGPIFVYQYTQSINHVIDVAGGADLMAQVIKPYQDEQGAIKMAKCCGGGSDRRIATAAVDMLPAIPVSADGSVILEYIGPMQGAFMLRHPVSGRTYKAGRNPSVRHVSVPPEDADYLLQFNTFRRVMPSPEYVDPPVYQPNSTGMQVPALTPLTPLTPITQEAQPAPAPQPAQEAPQATEPAEVPQSLTNPDPAAVAAFMAEIGAAMPQVAAQFATQQTVQAPVKRGRRATE